MSPAEPDRSPSPPDYRVNFFRPRSGFMRGEVVLIWVALVAWFILTFGFQFLLAGSAGTPENTPLTGVEIFGFPFDYWFTAQFLVVCFIVLCFVFNLMVDRLTERHRSRRP